MKSFYHHFHFSCALLIAHQNTFGIKNDFLYEMNYFTFWMTFYLYLIKYTCIIFIYIYVCRIENVYKKFQLELCVVSRFPTFTITLLMRKSNIIGFDNFIEFVITGVCEYLIKYVLNLIRFMRQVTNVFLFGLS